MGEKLCNKAHVKMRNCLGYIGQIGKSFTLGKTSVLLLITMNLRILTVEPLFKYLLTVTIKS